MNVEIGNGRREIEIFTMNHIEFLEKTWNKGKIIFGFYRKLEMNEKRIREPLWDELDPQNSCETANYNIF